MASDSREHRVTACVNGVAGEHVTQTLFRDWSEAGVCTGHRGSLSSAPTGAAAGVNKSTDPPAR